ncbi:interferon gamma receptor 1 [Podarcis raffonei]|uniref:interferon gamma receptor 1 n=1 Tax=Podarcis raffonei TaxID=65483 RepID=UPI0023296D81|nr:interferon gamma receptor 1 [Podarcis raffonei]
MGPAELLVALAVLPWAFRGGSGALALPEKVPSPTNIVIDSYNLNTSVQWDYKSVSSKTLFTVSIRCYDRAGDVEVDNCVNITQHYCDITHEVDESCDTFWVKVKALNGLHESDYTCSDRYHVFENGRIAPPKFNIYIENHLIIVETEVPLTPYGKKIPLTLRANITDFTSRVFLWEKGQPKKRQEFEAEDTSCSDTSCTISIQVPSSESLYCVSVQGFSEEFAIQSEESEERCIDIPPKHSSDLTVPITLGVTGFLLLAGILAGINKCFSKKQRTIKLPKSLAAVVRNMNPVNFDPRPEGRHAVLVTEPDIKPESDPSGETTGLSDSDQEADTLHSQRTSSLHEGIIVEISEGEQSAEENENYFRDVSGQEEMCSSVPNLDLPNADVEQPTLPDSCRNISGYDRRWLPPGVEEWLKTQSSSDTPEA